MIQVAGVSAEIVTTVIGVGFSTAFTIGVLKKGQSDNREALREHADTQQKELSGLREAIDRVTTEIHAAITAAARSDERLVALERAAEAGISGLRNALDRSQRDSGLARDELKGDLKRHGRDLEQVKVWRAAVNQKLVAIDPNWRAE